MLCSYCTGASLLGRPMIAIFAKEILSLSWQQKRLTNAFLNVSPDKVYRARLKKVLKAATGLEIMYAACTMFLVLHDRWGMLRVSMRRVRKI